MPRQKSPRRSVTLDTKKLRKILDDRGIRITEFARQANVPRQTIWNILATGRPVSRVILSRFAMALDIPREDILADGGDDDEAELAS